jgi:MSHA biogenesis protein MshQ
MTTARCLQRKLFSWVLLAGLALLLAGAAQAQTYAYQSAPYAWDAVTGGATKVTWNTSCTNYPNSPASGQPGDDVFAVVNFPGGFVFNFAGTDYSSIRVMSNGMLQFGPDAGYHRDYTPQALPITAAPDSGGTVAGSCARGLPSGLLIVYWRDIDAARVVTGTNPSGVYYELKGTAPNRRLVITWNNVYLYGQNVQYNFQAILREDGAFLYQYGSGSSDGSNATVGVQVDTADYTQYAYDQTFIDTTNGTAIRWYPTNVSPPSIGEYRLDEAVAWGAAPIAGEYVIDSSGTNHPGARVAVGTTYPAKLVTARVCAGATIPSNTANNLISAIDVAQGPLTIGLAGSATFWYRSTDAWTSSTAHTLFDATTVANRPFHLTKIRSGSNDVLRFAITDSANNTYTLETGDRNTGAGTWVHVGVSWYLGAGTNQSVMQIFINGVSAGFRRFTSSGALHSSLASLYFGDNRTSGVTPSNGSPNSAYGDLDEIRLYDFDISAPQATRDMNATRSNCSPFDHYRISHGGYGVTCQAENVTITAHDASHNPVPLLGTVMNISTSTGHGTWSRVSAVGTLTNLGGGAATYIWSGESEIVLGLADTYAETVNINLASGSQTETSGTSDASHDPSLIFSDAGFIFALADGSEAVIPSQVAGRTSATYYLRAVKTDRTTMACQTALTGTRLVNLAYRCVDPVTCTGSSHPVTVTAAETKAIAGNDLAAGWAATTGVNMAFGASGAAPLTFSFADVGQITLYASTTLGGATLTGTSNDFVVKPYTLELSPIASNPGAASAAGAKFVAAGTTFPVKITARAYGTPAVPIGAATPNYGHEVDPETGRLASTLVAPIPGANPGPTVSLGSFSNGEATGTAAWGEVGIVTLTPRIGDLDYLGAGDLGSGDGSALTPSGNVGRFYPDHFSLISASSTQRSDAPGCYGATVATQGDIAMATNVLTVTDASGLAAGDTVVVFGAGVSGGDLITTVSTIAGTAVTLAGNAATTVTGAPVFKRLGFSYLGEPWAIALALQARNADEGITTNYNTAGGFAKLTEVSPLGTGANSWGLWGLVNHLYGVVGCRALFGDTAPFNTSYEGVACATLPAWAPTAPYAASSPRIAATNTPAVTWAAGSGTLATDVVLRRAGVVDGPFDFARGTFALGAWPKDGDGVTLAAGLANLDTDTSAGADRLAIAVADLRFGRLRLQNAYGSELLTLPMPMTVESHGGADGWRRESGDACTRIDLPASAVSCTATSCDWSAFRLDRPTRSLNLTGTSPAPVLRNNLAGTTFVPVRGDFGLRFPAPGAGRQGSMRVTVTVPDYLKYRWTAAGTIDSDDPWGLATFGTRKSQFIFMREGY